jgi:methyl-accepting chemotaxis protein
LPCEDNICLQHLKEKEVVKQNAIKCVKCAENFPIKGHDFKSNKTLKQLIEDKSYLSEEEMNLKKNLEESIRKFFGFYDEFILNKSKVDTIVFNHFQELRFKIDEHRERLKAKIDDVALEMIEQTKKCEAEYLKEVKVTLLSSFDHSKSLDKDLEEIEEFFRNPNLLIQSIKEMQQRQEESLKEIQSKLNEINQVKVDLKAANEFVKSRIVVVVVVFILWLNEIKQLFKRGPI